MLEVPTEQEEGKRGWMRGKEEGKDRPVCGLVAWAWVYVSAAACVYDV